MTVLLARIVREGDYLALASGDLCPCFIGLAHIVKVDIQGLLDWVLYNARLYMLITLIG